MQTPKLTFKPPSLSYSVSVWSAEVARIEAIREARRQARWDAHRTAEALRRAAYREAHEDWLASLPGFPEPSPGTNRAVFPEFATEPAEPGRLPRRGDVTRWLETAEDPDYAR